NAIRSASCCGVGSFSCCACTGAHSWCRVANASSISVWKPAARITWQPCACSVRYSSIAVLPMPASPCTTRARLVPPPTCSTSRSSAANSAWRPKTGAGALDRPGITASKAGWSLHGSVIRPPACCRGRDASLFVDFEWSAGERLLVPGPDRVLLARPPPPSQQPQHSMAIRPRPGAVGLRQWHALVRHRSVALRIRRDPEGVTRERQPFLLAQAAPDAVCLIRPQCERQAFGANPAPRADFLRLGDLVERPA